jgi:hypothetical protein
MNWRDVESRDHGLTGGDVLETAGKVLGKLQKSQ